MTNVYTKEMHTRMLASTLTYRDTRRAVARAPSLEAAARHSSAGHGFFWGGAFCRFNLSFGDQDRETTNKGHLLVYTHQLLARYGFADSDNEHDYVSLSNRHLVYGTLQWANSKKMIDVQNKKKHNEDASAAVELALGRDRWNAQERIAVCTSSGFLNAAGPVLNLSLAFALCPLSI